jgi:aminopeptidase N
MSTYLLAFYIGYGDYVERVTNNGVTVRVYSTNKKEYSEFALDVGTKCVEYLADFFDYPYPLKKLDLLAVPELAAAAMENWGLIIFRDKILIYDPMVDISGKMTIAYTICHEIAHQWFGNLVTMNWWSELWLNESFATWIGWMVISKLFPDWNVWDHFYFDEFLEAMTMDSLQSSHPIQVSIENPSNINEIFDAVTYSKGSTILHMLVAYLGIDVFKKCMAHYFKTYHYSNAKIDDLWNCLEHISHKPVLQIMDDWINKKNYPLVSVDLIKHNQIRFRQEVFSFDKFRLRELDDPVWFIPLTRELILDHLSLVTDNIPANMKINKDNIGFYRVNYQPAILKNILINQYQNLSVLDITGILSDLFIMLTSNRIHFDYYLECLNIIINKAPVRSSFLANFIILNLSLINNIRLIFIKMFLLNPFWLALKNLVTSLLQMTISRIH